MAPTWITQGQRNKGIDGQSLISAVTHNWERKKPFKLAVLLGLLTKKFVSSLDKPILDLHFIQTAKNMSKIVSAIETTEEQCLVFSQINNTLVKICQSLI